ncbi:MAG: 50S ribosomal protein L4 [Evtepia gabavorous]
MPKANVYNMAGQQVGEVELSEGVFGVEPNEPAVHAVVVNHLANCRQGTQSALTRAESVRRRKKALETERNRPCPSGQHPCPQWTHGGIVFAPKPRDYSYRVNRKLKRLALKSALSAKAASGDLLVVDNLALDAIKTKSIQAFLDAVSAGKTIFITPEVNVNVYKSARNIPGVSTTTAKILSVYDIVNAEKLVIDQKALAIIEEVFA